MRTRSLLLGAFAISCTSAPTRKTPSPGPTPSREYAGVYISTPDEDYFTPCGVNVAGATWSLRFRNNEPHAPFLKKVAAIRGMPPLAHFIRIRGTLGPPGSYNVGFQTRELTVDSVLEVSESFAPCNGFGAPAKWNGVREEFRGRQAVALSNDRALVAVMDKERKINILSTETGQLVAKFASPDKGNSHYGPAQMVFSDDGNLLAVGGIDGIVRVWSPRTGKRIFSLALKDSAAVAREMAKIPPRADAPGYTQPLPPNSYTPALGVVFNKRGTMLATSNLFSTIVWSMKTGKKLAEFRIDNDFRRKTLFAGDGLLMAADSGRMILRSPLDGPPTILPGTRAAATEHVVMSPDGRTLAVHGWSDSVFLWSVDQGPGRVLYVPGSVTGAIAFSPDGATIAIAAGASELFLFDVRTGAPIRAFQNYPDSPQRVWFSADGKSIITVSTFDNWFRVVYIDPSARPAAQQIFDDSLTAQLPLGLPLSTSPKTIGGIVTGPNKRAVAAADVSISNGDAPDSIIARATTSAGGYFSFNGIRFKHVLIHVRKSGFAVGTMYIHVNRWQDDGPWGIELVPDSAR